jgi:hypothetical protein
MHARVSSAGPTSADGVPAGPTYRAEEGCGLRGVAILVAEQERGQSMTHFASPGIRSLCGERRINAGSSCLGRAREMAP